MRVSTRQLVTVLCLGAICTFGLGCGSGSESDTSAGSAPGVDAAAPAGESIQKISADAQRCLDLVQHERYAEALDPCQRALEQAANVDVERALAEARTGLESAASEAGMKAASDSMAGKPADQAAADAAKGAMGGLSTE